MRLASFDPGKTTGFVLATWKDDQLWIEKKHDISLISTLWKVLNEAEPDVIIYEKFMYRGGVSADLSGCRQEGIFDLYQYLNMCEVIVQKSTVKRFWTDGVLKDQGYTDSSKHCKDAIRHLLEYLTFNKKVYKLKRPT